MEKEKRMYHHKDLRNALIEKGIQLVHEEGINAFSLRKAAAACNVSHAAPYAHFSSKEDLLHAMQVYITEQFTKRLKQTLTDYQGSSVLLEKLGITYLRFFLDNPFYFDFLYNQSDIQIDLTSSETIQGNYPPFELFKHAVRDTVKETLPKDQLMDLMVSLWAFIHGITSLATMKNTLYREQWEIKLIDYMNIFLSSTCQSQEELL